MTEIAGKRVVVTGAASGLGAAVVSLCRQGGADVLALDINANEGKAIAESTGAKFMRTDVSQWQDWQAVAAALPEGLDHLHLNAGIQIAPPDAPLSDYRFANMDLDHYRKMMGVNIDGVVLGLRALLPLMNSGGSVVVTGSLAGVVPYAVDPLYSMSKHAVTGLVRSLRSELADQGLRINALCPGGIDTAIIPLAQRGGELELMDPDNVAAEVLRLFHVDQSGATWAKVSNQKPAWIIEPPGSRPPGSRRSGSRRE